MWAGVAAGVLAVAVTLAACEGRHQGDATGSRAVEARGESGAVAWLDGEPITVTEVRSLLRDGMAADPSRRRAAVEGVIARRLAAQEARRRGLVEPAGPRAKPPEGEGDRGGREEALLRDALYERIREDLELSDAELRAHYEQTRSRYLERQLRLRRQSFPDRAAAEAADAALGAAGRLDPGSAEEIAPAPVRELPAAVLPEASRLEKAGDLVLVARHGSAALVELVEVLPAEVQPFEAVRDRVEQSLRTLRGQEAMAALLDDLRAEARVEIDEASLTDGALWVEGAERQDATKRPEPTVESQPRG